MVKRRFETSVFKNDYHLRKVLIVIHNIEDILDDYTNSGEKNSILTSVHEKWVKFYTDNSG